LWDIGDGTLNGIVVCGPAGEEALPAERRLDGLSGSESDPYLIVPLPYSGKGREISILERLGLPKGDFEMQRNDGWCANIITGVPPSLRHVSIREVAVERPLSNILI
jgi:hypothetical protein